MPKRFRRVESGKKIAGVCTGLSEYFGIDVTLVRVAFIVLFAAGGAALLAYVILWIASPRVPGPQDPTLS